MSDVKKRQLVYQGWRLAPSRKRVYLYQDVDDNFNLMGTGETWTKPRKVKGWGVGSIYEITETADGKSYFTKGQYAPRYVGRYASSTDIASWVAAQEADAVTEAADKLRRKQQAMVEDLGNMTLKQLAVAYQTLPRGRERRAFELVVLSYLVKGR